MGNTSRRTYATWGARAANIATVTVAEILISAQVYHEPNWMSCRGWLSVAKFTFFTNFNNHMTVLSHPRQNALTTEHFHKSPTWQHYRRNWWHSWLHEYIRSPIMTSKATAFKILSHFVRFTLSILTPCMNMGTFSKPFTELHWILTVWTDLACFGVLFLVDLHFASEFLRVRYLEVDECQCARLYDYSWIVWKW